MKKFNIVNFFILKQSLMKSFCYLCSVKSNMEGNTMATVTINYDARNAAIRGMILALLKFDGVTEVKAQEKQADPYAKEIARRVAGVKNGKIKTRPVEHLLAEI